MLNTQAVEHFDTHLEGVFAFRINARLTNDDLQAMARVMNTAFDTYDEVDMLLVFNTDADSEFGAGLNGEAIKAQFRALTNVRNYCVSGAPDAADSMIKFFDKIMPVNASTFESEHNALEYLRAQPKVTSKAA